MPTARPLPARRADNGWLPLGPASRLIGVDPDTLRRWADDGRIRAWTTPGGHRRFDRRDLEQLTLAGRTGRQGPLAAIGATPDRLSAAFRRGYGRPAAGQGSRSWVGDGERETFREDGRRLVESLLQHLDVEDAESRERTEVEAASTAEALGRRLAAAGIPLDDAVAQFVAARRPFLAEIGMLARRRTLPPDRLADLYDRATAILDRLLLRFVAAHAATAPAATAPAATAPAASATTTAAVGKATTTSPKHTHGAG